VGAFWRQINQGKGDSQHCSLFLARNKLLTKTKAILSKFSTFHGRQMEVSTLEKEMERRQYTGLHMAIPFHFTVTQANQTGLYGQQGTSKTINVGLGGVFFKTDLALQVGNKLELDLRLSPSQHVCASGWIIRSDMVSRPTYVNGTIVVRSSYSIGVEFQQLDGAERLREYLVSEEGDSHQSSENSLGQVVKRLRAGLQKLSKRINQHGDR